MLWTCSIFGSVQLCINTIKIFFFWNTYFGHQVRLLFLFFVNPFTISNVSISIAKGPVNLNHSQSMGQLNFQWFEVNLIRGHFYFYLLPLIWSCNNKRFSQNFSLVHFIKSQWEFQSLPDVPDSQLTRAMHQQLVK